MWILVGTDCKWPQAAKTRGWATRFCWPSKRLHVKHCIWESEQMPMLLMLCCGQELVVFSQCYIQKRFYWEKSDEPLFNIFIVAWGQCSIVRCFLSAGVAKIWGSNNHYMCGKSGSPTGQIPKSFRATQKWLSGGSTLNSHVWGLDLYGKSRISCCGTSDHRSAESSAAHIYIYIYICCGVIIWAKFGLLRCLLSGPSLLFYKTLFVKKTL